MSTFSISLAIAGGLLLVLIVAYNTWTARRNAPKRAAPRAPERPAQEPDLRQEPVLDGAPPPAAASAVGADPALAAPPGHAVDTADEQALPVPALHVERRASLDGLIDAIAPLATDHPVAGEAALAALPPTRRAGSKPFGIEGLNDASGEWEPPHAGQRYRAFHAGVQLANRTGALNEIEFSEFVAKAQAFADAVGAAPDFPDMLHEVARARELDQFASEHDAQLAFVLRARSAAWSPGYVQQNAAAVGFVPGAMPGRMALPSAHAGMPPLLTLTFDTQAALSDDPEQSALRDVLLSLDVPQVHRSEQPYARLRQSAEALCAAMDGVLCDQTGQPLPAMALDPIAADLEGLYDQLDARELSAGSALARRLFS